MKATSTTWSLLDYIWPEEAYKATEITLISLNGITSGQDKRSHTGDFINDEHKKIECIPNSQMALLLAYEISNIHDVNHKKGQKHRWKI